MTPAPTARASSCPVDPSRRHVDPPRRVRQRGGGARAFLAIVRRVSLLVRARGNAAVSTGGSSSLVEPEIPSRLDRENRTPSSAPIGANEVDDPGRARGLVAPKTVPVVAGFPAFSDAGMSPPDPIIAAGPDHVVVAVNSKWGIFTKSGTLIFQASAVSGFGHQLSAVHAISLLPYDPQVAYDHYRGRWILVYSATDTASQSWILLSVSSSSDPTAPWYSWALPGDVNGTTPAANFSDFPALGFDDSAIYIATNQFRYATPRSRTQDPRPEKDPLYAGASGPGPTSGTSRTPRPDRRSTRFGRRKPRQLRRRVPRQQQSVHDADVRHALERGRADAGALALGGQRPVTATREPPGADQKGGSPGTAGCPTPCLIDTGRGSITSAVFERLGVVFHTVADAGGVTAAPVTRGSPSRRRPCSRTRPSARTAAGISIRRSPWTTATTSPWSSTQLRRRIRRRRRDRPFDRGCGAGAERAP
jgi:hypothetical protein